MIDPNSDSGLDTAARCLGVTVGPSRNPDPKGGNIDYGPSYVSLAFCGSAILLPNPRVVTDPPEDSTVVDAVVAGGIPYRNGGCPFGPGMQAFVSFSGGNTWYLSGLPKFGGAGLERPGFIGRWIPSTANRTFAAGGAAGRLGALAARVFGRLESFGRADRTESQSSGSPPVLRG
jgi:hypothetical protein